ncbi:S-layer homology domain-containing protein [Lactococcus garvieae]|uniref:S-layer homology domain-containing protein n=1 Tax=Lactococcus garvieae TaxID=1363 RepID=UPI0018D97277|nr:S-layer homology domain-containing protein [Lactococcus garvieae]QPS71790.1 S-layer homology domain-containing protein [Lactococcus garvieae]
MKKYQKILMLSAVFLSSTQGIMVSASELVSVNKENNDSIASNVEESSTSSSADKSEISSESQSTSSVLTEENSSSTNTESSTEKQDTADASTESISTTDSPKIEVRSAVTYQQPLEKGTLPKIPVTLGKLPAKNSGNPFKDISQSLFKNHINWIYSRGITTGYTPTTYNPNAYVTRGEMAVFLHRLAGAPSYKAPFNVYTDVTQYKNQILWLTATTISSGTAPHYNPNGNVTRGQMAAFLHRMAKVSGNAPTTGKYSSNFADVKNHMFANDIGWLSSKGITTGYTATSFKPNANVTRGEMAAFLSRFYNITTNRQNPYPAGQCTAYVWDYFNGNIPTYVGNAKEWVKYANSKPAAGTIAVFPPGNQGAGSLGHVAVVLSVSGSKMRVSEGNYNGGWGTERVCSTTGVKFIRP